MAVLVVGHVATHVAWITTCAGTPLPEAVSTEFAWLPGWDHVLDPPTADVIARN